MTDWEIRLSSVSCFIDLSRGRNCSSRKESRRTVKRLIRRRKKQMFDDKKKKKNRERAKARDKIGLFYLTYLMLAGYLETAKRMAKIMEK